MAHFAFHNGDTEGPISLYCPLSQLEMTKSRINAFESIMWHCALGRQTYARAQLQMSACLTESKNTSRTHLNLNMSAKKNAAKPNKPCHKESGSKSRKAITRNMQNTCFRAALSVTTSICSVQPLTNQLARKWNAGLWLVARGLLQRSKHRYPTSVTKCTEVLHQDNIAVTSTTVFLSVNQIDISTN